MKTTLIIKDDPKIKTTFLITYTTFLNPYITIRITYVYNIPDHKLIICWAVLQVASECPRCHYACITSVICYLYS